MRRKNVGNWRKKITNCAISSTPRKQIYTNLQYKHWKWRTLFKNYVKMIQPRIQKSISSKSVSLPTNRLIPFSKKRMNKFNALIVPLLIYN